MMDKDWLPKMERREIANYVVLADMALGMLAENDTLSSRRKACAEAIKIGGELSDLCRQFPEVLGSVPLPSVVAADPETSLYAIKAWCSEAKRALDLADKPPVTGATLDIARFIYLNPGRSSEQIAEGMNRHFVKYRERWESKEVEMTRESMRRIFKVLRQHGFRSGKNGYLPPIANSGAAWERPVIGCDRDLKDD